MKVKCRKYNSVYACFIYAGILIFAGLTGCTPTVQVNAPSEPITINMNVKIDHEVRVKVDRDLDAVISKDSGLF